MQEHDKRERFQYTTMSQTKISGAEILMRSLVAEGTTTLFGYPGGSIMPVYDALYDYTDRLNHILVRHEQGAIHAAQGYSRANGKVGVCIVTSGPGVTNTVTGVADAMLDSTPVVVIAGQVGTPFLGSDAFQECDIINVMQPICKWVYQIRSAAEVSKAVAQAFYVASSGRPGPVVLDFTKNAQVEKTEYIPYQNTFWRGYESTPPTNKDSIQKAAELINNAKRPFVLIGQGVSLGNAQDEVIQFIEKADMPAGCTLLGLSCLPSGHPLNMGMLGMHGNYAPNIKTQECDLLIAVGMRFDDRITGRVSTYAKQAKKIHFDIDPSEINKNIPVDIAVLGNCKDTIKAVTDLIRPNRHEEWRNSFMPYYEQENEIVIQAETKPTEGPLLMGEVISRVSTLANDDAIVVTDVGQNQMMAARYSRYTHMRSMITSGGMGTMGFGLPAAIGATFAGTGRTVCLFVGDGGIQMTIQELGTIMENQCPVKIILLNNNYLGNVRQWQELFFNHRYSFTPMASPDYSKIADAYHIPYILAAERENLDEAIKKMLTTDGPVLMEVAIKEEDNVMPMCFPGNDVDNMILKVESQK